MRLQISGLNQTQAAGINAAIAAGLAPLRVPDPMPLSVWADNNFYLSPESSSSQGPWKSTPPQVGVMNAISNDDIRTLTVMKSARVGYTKMIVAATGYFAEHRRRSQVLYQPTDDDGEDFVKTELNPMLRDCPSVAGVFRGEYGKLSEHNTLTKKTFFGSILDVLGANTARNFRRLTKDVVYYDELDGFARDIDKEGDPVSLGDKRIVTSPFPKSVRGSTPRIAGQSMIEEYAAEADWFFRFYLECPDCGHYDYLRWKDQFKYTDDDPESIRCACLDCGSLWAFSQLDERLDTGIWIDEKAGIQTVDFLTFIDTDTQKEVPPAPHVSLHIWAAYSTHSHWSELVREWLKAQKAKNEGDIRKLKTFINTRLGEVWKEEGIELDPETVQERARRYEKVDDTALLLTCAVDVQDDRLEAEVKAWSLGEESYSVSHDIFYGDPGKAELWNRLEDHLKKKFERDDGQQMRIVSTAIDSGGHYTQHVYKFVHRQKGKRRVFAIKGVGGAGRPIIGRPTKANDLKVPVYPVGVDTAKELFFGRLQIKEPGPGFCHYPTSYDEEFFEQLTAEKRVERRRGGKIIYEWQKIRRRNEAFDLGVYNVAAFELLNPNLEAIAGKRASRAETESEDAETPPKTSPRKRRSKHRVRRGKGGFVKSWKQ